MGDLFAGPGLLTYVAVTSLLVLTPGASTAVVVRAALEGGRLGALLTATGIAAANSTYAIATAFGIAAVLQRNPMVFEAIRLGGALYLVALGVSSVLGVVRRRPRPAAAEGAVRTATRRGRAATFLAQGVLTNLLNPSIALFYLTYVPQFAAPGPAFRAAFLLLAAAHVGLAFCCHGAYGLVLGRVGSGGLSERTRGTLSVASGVALALVGVSVAWP